MKKNHPDWWYLLKPSNVKILRVMKLTIVLMFMGIMSVSAGGYSQGTKVTLSLENVKLSRLFKAIEKETSYRFVFSNDILPQGKIISVHVNATPVSEVLNQALESTQLKYRFLDESGIIIISEKNSNSINEDFTKIAHIIRGQVTDNKGQPLYGVTVQVKGSVNATTTGSDGSFVIEVQDDATLLVFSYVGMETQEVNIENKSAVQISMKPSAQSLNDVVVIGYGTQKKKDLTGAISSIKLENSPVALLPNVNFLDALKGRLPGLDIGVVNNAGGNPSFNIRGQNSIRASNAPLIVLDGVVFTGSFNEINPSDIASVDVLKDAGSAAVYGSNSANGVILITTKKGKTGKPVINFRATSGIQTYTRKPDMRDGKQFLQFRYDAKKMDGASPSDLEIDRLLYPKELEAYNAGHTVNWWNEVVKPAPFQDYQMSVSGGSEGVNYYISGDYMNQKGIVYNDQFKKFTFLAKVEAKITSWLKYGLTLSVASKNADGVSADLEKATILGPYSYVHSTFPGFEDWYERYPQTSTTTFSPFWRTLTYDEDRNQNYRSTNSLRFDIPWVDGLSYTATYALNRWEGHGSRFNNEKTFVNTLRLTDLQDQTKYLVDANGYRNNSQRTDWFLNHLINYNHRFNDHSFDVTLLAERQEVKNRNMSLSAKDFSQAGTTVLGVNSLELGDPTKRSISTGLNKLDQLAYMARVNYVYKQRYHLSASIRKDGYSGFATGNQYGTFRALAAAWTASGETFVEDNLPFVNFLKLRASYGENGNPTVGAYATFPNIATNNYLFGTNPVNTASVNQLANKALKWETTTSFNIGMDFSIFKDVVSGNIDYYNSNTTNLLIRRAIPIMNGFTTVDDNLGKNHNSGIEIQLNTNNIATKDFSWSSGLYFWKNTNKIITIYGLDGNKDGKEDDDIANGYFIGKSLGAIYDYTFDGIIQTEDTAFISTYGGRPGDIKLKDLNNNGKIDPDDRSVIGYTKPNYSLSFSNTISYKNLELYFMFSTIQGGGKNNYYLASNQYAQNPNTLYASIANWLDKPYWMPDHQSDITPRPNYSNRYGYRFSEDHSFVRLQDVVLSYYFDKKILTNTPIKSLRAYIAGKNLFTWTNWEGLDPETATTFASVNGFPVMKTITFGLDISF